MIGFGPVGHAMALPLRITFLHLQALSAQYKSQERKIVPNRYWPGTVSTTPYTVWDALVGIASNFATRWRSSSLISHVSTRSSSVQAWHVSTNFIIFLVVFFFCSREPFPSKLLTISFSLFLNTSHCVVSQHCYKTVG